MICLMQVHIVPWHINTTVSLSRLGDKLRSSLDFYAWDQKQNRVMNWATVGSLEETWLATK